MRNSLNLTSRDVVGYPHSPGWCSRVRRVSRLAARIAKVTGVQLPNVVAMQLGDVPVAHRADLSC
jgi:hypothetical protein